MDVATKSVGRHDIFESYRQIIKLDPARCRPIMDRILVRDVPDEEFSPSGICLTAAPSLGGLGKSGRIRVGDVIAVGKGEPYYQYTEDRKQKAGAYPCPNCQGSPFFWDPIIMGKPCPRCGGRGHSHVDMLVRVGDRVVIDRRKEAEVYIEGTRYTICYERQACYGRYVYNLRTNLTDFECLYDRVLIEPAEPVQTGMIARPGNAKSEQFREGIVRAVGQGTREADGKIHPLEVKPGDRVLFRAEGGAQRAEDITLFGEGLLIMREKLIWAVL